MIARERVTCLLIFIRCIKSHRGCLGRCVTDPACAHVPTVAQNAVQWTVPGRQACHHAGLNTKYSIPHFRCPTRRLRLWRLNKLHQDHGTLESEQMADSNVHMQSLNSCQIHEWLPSFRDLAYKTEIVELPQSWLVYLTADGVYVEEDSKAVSL